MRSAITILASIICIDAANAQSIQHFDPVVFSRVNITDHFWKPKMDLVATTTLNACIYQTEVATPRLRNFEKVARKKGEKHEGIFYDDSDVFKALEAMSYSIANDHDSALEAKADEWIDKIAAAQLPDGYLNTYFTLNDLSLRWTDMSMHEDYNAGHMIEAAVAYYNATGKRKFLDICIKWADYFDSVFGPGKRHWVTGHEELELALVKLYRVTGNKKYLNLSHWLLEERGHGYAHGYTWTDWKDTAYAQDVLPVSQQTEITGHAVRAMYLYTGAADVAAQTGDTSYMNAMKNVWNDVVGRNMYITGGIGSSGGNEGFSKDYDLPNEYAYCETCASVGMVFWNQRMNALTGESKYMDVLERSLYNGALDGISISGDHFFYGNPLASNGQNSRREWFGTACCPANIARLIASLGNYIYANNEKDIWVNLFVGSNTNIALKKGNVGIRMETNYPWDGNINITAQPDKKMQYALHIRIPGWAVNTPVPGDLYGYTDHYNDSVTILVNGKPATYNTELGYAVIDREWKKGDVVTMLLPMQVRKIVARSEVTADANRIALQRGPLVYCVEMKDNNEGVWNLLLPQSSTFIIVNSNVLTEKIVALEAKASVIVAAADGNSVNTQTTTIKAIPYYTWANRGNNAMQVWLPTKVTAIKIN
ncbi:glycoside hydrolase family 127 protein [Panacibacter ginsenosidivorans]|uniref:Glycoside hydrolase family 127 protein n=1 Tax=Panacibacter ginsenosidivorans TaxID=1813871 RepID=A0A5B8VGZ1_9BACT|nr:beta-L-arabinofuranosidase domain-containing protein [Panacibacter ginsenosidivorans]QEC69836.1 glycoside hydrolase family 127 protein [Panacibacter ginsenosidivorans]